MKLKTQKYQELIYHMKKVIDISRELNEKDLTILKELLNIEQSKRKIYEAIK